MIKYITWLFSAIYSLNAGLSLYRLGDVISKSTYIKNIFPWTFMSIIIIIISIIGSCCLAIGYFISMIKPIKLELEMSCFGNNCEITILKITNIIGSIIYSTFKSFNTADLLSKLLNNMLLNMVLTSIILIVDLICTKSWLSYEQNQKSSIDNIDKSSDTLGGPSVYVSSVPVSSQTLVSTT